MLQRYEDMKQKLQGQLRVLDRELQEARREVYDYKRRFRAMDADAYGEYGGRRRERR